MIQDQIKIILKHFNAGYYDVVIAKTNKLLNGFKKNLVIYSYSISNNFLKEVFSKIDMKFTLTNDFRKASLIIGLTKHLQQNLKLNQFAKEKKIPIYAFQQISIYQLIKFIKIIK